MFDVKSAVNRRYFEVKLTMTTEDGRNKDVIINVEPPKLKVLKKITGLSKMKDEEAVDELADSIKMILNKNKEHKKVDEFVEEMDFDEMQLLLTSYFEWIEGEKTSKN